MRDDSAVSPVVGTMILLTVVVVLAALLAAFASGVAEEQKPAPSAEIAVYPAGRGGAFALLFEHRGGDAVKTEDIKIKTWVHLPDGRMKEATHASLSDTVAYAGEDLRLPCSWSRNGSDPYRENFGDAVWLPGTVATTGNLETTGDFLGLESGDLKRCIEKEAVLEVKIFHLPSGTLVQTSTILMKEG
ncbi:flagellin-like protein [Methanofollis sp. W23]|uniref:type IV pilin n=1 Tax=Methanofollis sp. W23 TaxID=2817849 RepID=UPI001AE1A1BF|nr:type IV pilin N-terminal domain-containing protein [Methanofollis sp. W23]MBP2145326.1 flagellin-like protein [Methanofollis sp. W23]